MGRLRYFRRVQIAPGVRLHLSRRGTSLSFGVRGAHVTVGRNGIRRTVGLPGSGVFYTSSSGRHSGFHTAPQFEAPTAMPDPPGSHRGGITAIVLLTLVLIALALIGQVFGR